MRAILGFFAFPIVGFVASIVYVYLVGTVMGRGDFALVGAFGTLPIFVSMCGLLWVLLHWAWRGRTGHRMSTPGAMVLAAVVALGFGLVVAGPAGFTGSGGALWINVVLLVVVPAAVLVYRRVAGWRGGDPVPSRARRP